MPPSDIERLMIRRRNLMQKYRKELACLDAVKPRYLELVEELVKLKVTTRSLRTTWDIVRILMSRILMLEETLTAHEAVYKQLTDQLRGRPIWRLTLCKVLASREVREELFKRDADLIRQSAEEALRKASLHEPVQHEPTISELLALPSRQCAGSHVLPDRLDLEQLLVGVKSFNLPGFETRADKSE